MSILKYKTIESPASGSFRDRGSKFLSYAFPVQDDPGRKAQLKELRSEHPKANHHCYACRLGATGDNFRAIDDGEPAGSAGKPILNTIDSTGLTNTLVVVVRYFGGTLLGIPGLISAYKTAASEALKAAVILEQLVEEHYEILFDYPVMSSVMRLLHTTGATIFTQELQLFCRITAGIPVAHKAVLAQLSELRGVTVKPIAAL